MAAVESPSERRENRGPSVRRRYVTRAKTLIQDRLFQEAMREARSRWDTAFPAYSIGRPSQCPGPTIPTINSTHTMPPKLMSAWTRAKEERRFDHREEPAWDAWRSWEGLVNAGCQRWWPSRFFPNYIGWGRHPASLFFSCCIAYDERTVPTTLIPENHYVPEHHPFDPTDDDSNPVVIGLRAERVALQQALRDALAPHGDAAEKAINHARNVGFWAQHEAEMRNPMALDPSGEYLTSGWWYVPLLPEMTTSDWYAMRTEAIATVRRVYGEDPVRSYILQLSEDQVRAPQIARLLGVSERHVFKVLRERKEATEQ